MSNSVDIFVKLGKSLQVTQITLTAIKPGYAVDGKLKLKKILSVI
ncbi:hypothetical protein [Anabaena sp. PCC 7108]|nr:hypothetical protein [Anabaena sp. PCC 7108]